MSDLEEFLIAQYDRIEETARAATEGPWSVGSVMDDIGTADVLSNSGNVTSAREEPCCSIEDATHIAIHDPVAVLADIESKRRILTEIAEQIDGMADQIDGEFRVSSKEPGTDRSDHLLRFLAAPFSAEPGYDERWAV